MEDNITEILVGIGGTAGIGIPLIKWVISDWFKKSKELVALKEEKQNESINSLNKEVGNLKERLKSHAKQMLSFYDKIEEMESKMFQACQKFDEVKDELVGVSETNKKVTENINNLIKKEVKSQVVQLTNELRIIKSKKS